MNAALQRLQEKRAIAWTRMTEITDLAERENRDLSAEERTNWDTANRDLTDATADKERFERQQVLEAESRATTTNAAAAPVEHREERPAETNEQRDERVFSQFLRRGMEGLRSNEDRQALAARWQDGGEDESRAEGVATGSAGGYLVPPGYWEKLTVAMKAYGGLLNYVNIIDTTTGNPLQWPSSDDTSNVGSILGENVQVTDQDIVFGTKALNAYTYTSNQVRASLQLMQDSAFDVDAFVRGRFAERIGRAQAQHIATGTGTNQPQGIVTGTTNVTTLANGNTTTVTYDGLVDLTHSIDPAYRNARTRFVMHDLSIGAIRKLKDTQGRPLWQPDFLAGDNRDTVLGYPVAIDNSLATPAAGSTSILFGDFFSGYVWRRVLGTQVLRLNERYADFLQVAFIGFMRGDGKVDDPRAIAALKQSAT